jgi:hypothetical protein
VNSLYNDEGLLQRYPRLRPQSKPDPYEDLLAIQAFGRRIYDGQTLYEYLLEFLLIFVSPKGFGAVVPGSEYQLPIPPDPDAESDRLVYMTTCRMGLKRFIFLERSKQEHKYAIDQEACDRLMQAIGDHTIGHYDASSSNAVISVVQDLFYGFNAVIRNRAWFAQSLLPVAPELIFCEAIRSKSRSRSAEGESPNFAKVDGDFNFSAHNFLARGGEVYFLHVLQGLVDEPDLRTELETGLKRLVCESFPQLGELALWIDECWLDLNGVNDPIRHRMECEWIPFNGYNRRARLTCVELRNLLNSKLPPLTQIDLLAKLVVLQVLRMMHERARLLVTRTDEVPCWVAQVRSDPHHNVRRYSVQSYSACEEDFVKALDVQYDLRVSNHEPRDMRDRVKQVNDSLRHSSRLFRRLGKELGIVAPPRGANMRFALSEDMVRILVISTIEPGERVLLSSFLDRVYGHYGIVIGPDQISESSHLKNLDPGDMDANRQDFQEMLRRCGFLRDLSDATSIVENPFGG